MTRDVIYFWIVAGLAAVAADAAIGRLLPWDAAIVARLAIGAFLSLPAFALFVRRLHDQDRTGWWVLMLPPLIAYNLYRSIQVMFLSGTIGPNRYGPDPREGSEVASAA